MKPEVGKKPILKKFDARDCLSEEGKHLANTLNALIDDYNARHYEYSSPVDLAEAMGMVSSKCTPTWNVSDTGGPISSASQAPKQE